MEVAGRALLPGIGVIFPWHPPDYRVADQNDSSWDRWVKGMTHPGKWRIRFKNGQEILEWLRGGVWRSVTNTTSSSPATAPSQTLAYTGAVTAGDALVCATRQGTGATTTCDDSVNGGVSFPWTVIGPTDNGAGRQYVFVWQNTAAGTPTITLRYNTGSQAPRIVIGEVPSTIGAGSLDATPTGTTNAGSTTASITTATLAQASETVVLAVSAAANQTFTSSWGTVAIQEPAAASARLCLVYLDVASTTAVTATATLSASAAWIAQAATFRLAGAAATSLPIFRKPIRFFSAHR